MTDLDALCASGYFEGRDLTVPTVGANHHPAFVHGFRCGRDDAEVAAKLRSYPSRTAQKAREDWAYIKASEV